MLLLEAVALVGLALEGGAYCFEGIVWGQPSFERHTIDYQLWVKLSTQLFPILYGIFENKVFINGMITFLESFIYTIIYDCRVDAHFFH